MSNQPKEAVFLVSIGTIPSVAYSDWYDFIQEMKDHDFLDKQEHIKNKLNPNATTEKVPFFQVKKQFGVNIQGLKNMRFYNFPLNSLVTPVAENYTL